MKKILIFIFLFFNITGFGQISRGANISYRYTGNASFPYNYTITITTYTKSTSGDNCELMVNFGDGDTAFAPRINGPMGVCAPFKDGVLISSCDGILRYSVYEISHNYAGPGNYNVSADILGRDLSICNMVVSGNESINLQTELIISTFLGPSNGPSYTAIPAICSNTGVIVYYNPEVIDVDGDSLHYELIPSMSNGTSVASWTNPQHSNSFTINDTGTVIWDKPTLFCEYVFDIKISEWRNISGTYYLVGKTMQEVWAEVSVLGGIKENNPSVSLTAFPNPSSGFINFKIESEDQNSEYELNISNSLGQTIQTIAIKNNLATLEESNLPAGMYFYTLSSKQAIVNKGKFVILEGNMK